MPEAVTTGGGSAEVEVSVPESVEESGLALPLIIVAPFSILLLTVATILSALILLQFLP